MNAPAAKLAPPPRANRMKLDAVVSGRVVGPIRILIHGVDGVGKSSFGASAPKPIFLGTEDGTEHLDIARLPAPESWADILDAVQTLTTDPHDYQTLVIDSLDWAEPILWKHICSQDGVSSIEAVGGGYGKGYTAAVDGWRVLIAALERMQNTRKINLVLIAHTLIKPFNNPFGENFDRYILKLNEKAAGVLREWCKGVYFANYETFAVKEKAKKVRGVTTGARILYTQHTAAYDAKDRYGLPEQLALSWEEFDKAREAGAVATPEALKEEIKRKAAELGPDIVAKIEGTLQKAGDDPRSLAAINNRLNTLLSEKKEQQQ